MRQVRVPSCGVGMKTEIGSGGVSLWLWNINRIQTHKRFREHYLMYKYKWYIMYMYVNKCVELAQPGITL